MKRFLDSLKTGALATAAFLLLLGGVSHAAPSLNGTFATSGTPGSLVRGPDGGVWFTLAGSSASKEFGRIEQDGTVEEFDSPNDQAVIGIGLGPSSSGGPSDRIWFSQNGGVLRWDPVTRTGDTFAVPALGGPRGITSDGDGFIWAVDDNDGLIRIDPANGSVLNELNVLGSGGRGIALGGDDALWWADFAQGTINRTLPTAPFATTSLSVGGGPQEVAAGPGAQLGYTNQGAFPHQVGRILSPSTFAALDAPDTDPFGIARASDRNYWIANFFSEDLGRLTPGGTYSRPVEMPNGSGPRYVAAGRPGTLWASLETSGEIARVTGVPVVRTVGPRITRLRVTVKKRRGTARFRLRFAARLRISIQRRQGGPKLRTIRTISRKGRGGGNRIGLGQRLRPGRYVLRVRATYVNGRRSPVATRGFAVRRR
jgi:streptogramin lyase